MICRNCKSYYVRAPCPQCGHDPSRSDKKEDERTKLTPSQIRARETESGDQVLLQRKDEERLVRPSERFKRERADEEIPSFERTEKQEDGERLVKPSERFKRQKEEDEDLPSFQRYGSDQEKQEPMRMKPTQVRKKEDEEIPSFMRFNPDTEKSELDHLSKELNSVNQGEKLKNDKEYRKKVKETLEEVMGLLEKLIDDE